MLFLKTITHRNSYSKKTLKLIRTIVLNFAILLSALALMYIVPGIFLAHFLVLGDPKYQSYKQFGMSVLVFNCCSYSFVSTIINIVVTKPYRRAVMGKLRMRRATESR
ncbi:hypothetical protein L596_026593 [Steinernema carpocapsae]|uniref:Uncharacterized protein n=1 Tax=Steinernema carpocapsae TaxID=34508 RepID=A0A4U5M1W7_STECR|nr:hypothetical protein L596_026593 [Steinernema carpocapsae]